jgi:hypothetical protein
MGRPPPQDGVDRRWRCSFGEAPNQGLVASTNEKAFVNLGLMPYFRFTVVFDVERGLVGFAPCT